MYKTSLSACQNSKLSIAEALAVGTKSTAPALGLGRIVSCHSLVAQITKRGLLFDCMLCFLSHASQPAWSALSIWVDRIYHLDHCCNGYCWAGNRTQRFTNVARPTRNQALLALTAPFFWSTPGTPISVIWETLAPGG